MINYDVLNRWTGAVSFTARIDCAEDAASGIKAGLAVLWVIKANKDNSHLRNADLRGADLGGADLGGAFLGGADLGGAFLGGADLGGAFLGGADLRGADLRGADLGGAFLGGADLRGADLRGADLRGAVLRNADLCNADLRGADLRGADLRGAVLRNADLRGAKGIFDCGIPHEYRIVIVEHNDGIRIAAGCRWMTFRDAVAYWRAEGARKPMSGPLLAYIEAAVKAKGWTL